ncbi:hypothetical protein N7532_009483 [Penicillium argentinense]|uniref:Uncharacterized protein n=1 Tax=Penicillium argentinense TaxID=1131581 RepID=A0A9W9EZC3_9EURO|nr:uncharacterized protein N7532_009483 [Penicillium argentinense]KAJ5090799.1 hypothetical protein N7532_009483 [Penicillium argentinense]
MYLPQKRALSRKNGIFIVCASVILFVLASCTALYFGARWLRQRHYNPKYIPGQYFKRKWKHWCPGSASYGQVPNQGAVAADNDTSYHGGGGMNPEMTTATTATTNNDGVQRETSIRSIITLPPYSASPKPTEQVVAREGERGGMDMVVEFPETNEEQETRREEQMEALYQLRLQRRQELADREARRRERREARSRGDSIRLEQLAAESRARNNRRREGSNTSLSASAVVADHQSRERDRRISAVSYADIGHVRHDGSRLRADSHDSDHHPLLQHASRDTTSPSLAEPSSMNSRVQSMSSSILTTDTAATEIDHWDLHPVSTRGSGHPTPQNEEGDIGTLNIVPPPPEYEYLDWGDAPAYESPVRERQEESERLTPLLTRLPSIHVNIASPITISPVTPTGLQPQGANNDNDPPTPTESMQERGAVSSDPGSTTVHAGVS